MMWGPHGLQRSFKKESAVWVRTDPFFCKCQETNSINSNNIENGVYWLTNFKRLVCVMCVFKREPGWGTGRPREWVTVPRNPLFFSGPDSLFFCAILFKQHLPWAGKDGSGSAKLASSSRPSERSNSFFWTALAKVPKRFLTSQLWSCADPWASHHGQGDGFPDWLDFVHVPISEVDGLSKVKWLLPKEMLCREKIHSHCMTDTIPSPIPHPSWAWERLLSQRPKVTGLPPMMRQQFGLYSLARGLYLLLLQWADNTLGPESTGDPSAEQVEWTRMWSLSY